jgi:hypothetical protein
MPVAVWGSEGEPSGWLRLSTLRSQMPPACDRLPPALGDLRKDAVERAAGELGGDRTFAGALDVLDMTVDEWGGVIETNMRGVFIMCQAAARSMTAGAPPGKIITMPYGAYASGHLSPTIDALSFPQGPPPLPHWLSTPDHEFVPGF